MVSYSMSVTIETIFFTALWILLSLLGISRKVETKSERKLGKRESIFINTLIIVVIFLSFLFFDSYILRFIYVGSLGVFLLFLFRKGSASQYNKIGILSIVMIILLVSKIQVMYVWYPHAKSGSDSWSLLAGISKATIYGQIKGSSYYTVLPFVYAVILFLQKITGLFTSASMSFYFLVVNLLSLLFVYLSIKYLSYKEEDQKIRFYMPIMAAIIFLVFQYHNAIALREVPQATGMLGMVFGVFLLIKSITKFSGRKNSFLLIIASFFSISHPWGPIFLTFLFLPSLLLTKKNFRYDKFLARARSLYNISDSPDKLDGISWLMAFLPIIIFLFYTNALPFFFERHLAFISHIFSILRGNIGYDIAAGVGMGFEGKYPTDLEKIFYSLNWSVPASIVLSYALLCLIDLFSKRHNGFVAKKFLFIFIASIVSISAFSFSFMYAAKEYALSRYTGAYGILISVLPASYFLTRIARSGRVIISIVVGVIIILAGMSTLTDPTLLPEVDVNGVYVRNRIQVSQYVSLPELHASEFTVYLASSKATILVDEHYSGAFVYYLSIVQNDIQIMKKSVGALSNITSHTINVDYIILRMNPETFYGCNIIYTSDGVLLVKLN